MTSRRQIRSAGFAGDDEDGRRQRRKGVEESGLYRASQLPLMVEDDGAKDGAPPSLQHDRGGAGDREIDGGRRRRALGQGGEKREARCVGQVGGAARVRPGRGDLVVAGEPPDGRLVAIGSHGRRARVHPAPDEQR